VKGSWSVRAQVTRQPARGITDDAVKKAALRFTAAFLGVLFLWLPLAAQSLPKPDVTPGKVRPLTTAQTCSIKWGRDRRHVTNTMKHHW
jgi:hypothetical protein